MQQPDETSFPDGAARLAQRFGEARWRETPLGPPGDWPPALRTAAQTLSQSDQPLLIGWGPRFLGLCNDAFAGAFQVDALAVLGRPLGEAIGAEWAGLRPAAERALAGVPQWIAHDWAGHHGAAPRRCLVSATPIADGNGGTGGVFLAVVASDAATLHGADPRRYAVFQQAPGFICIMTGAEHRFTFVNDAHVRLFGHPDAIGRTVREVFPERVDAEGFAALDQVYATGEPHVARGRPTAILNAAGQLEERRLDLVMVPLRDPDGRIEGVLCEGQDVTEAYRAENALAEREEQLRLATEAADIGLWDVDVVRDTLYWPPRVKAMFGISADRAVSLADFYAGLHPEDREHTAASFAAACDPARRALYDVEYRTVGKEDAVVRWVAAKGRGVFDEAGRCVRVIGTAIDVTTRKSGEAALRRSEEELRESARRKDEFIATLAHELRNPLAALSSALQLLDRRGEASRWHEMMKRQVGHLVRLVDDLLEVSRISSGSVELRRETLSVADVVAHAVETSSPGIVQRRHRLTVHPPTEPIHVDGDPVRLAQIVSNLLNNAARFTPEGGRIDVRAERVADGCVISIADTGQGFTADRRGRMFEMFGRGPDSTGLGIGLALSRRLAELHDGGLEATSDGPGLGSVFSVRLPCRTPPPEPGGGARRTEEAVPSRADVLVVDDNRDAADAVAELLGLSGAEVRLAYDGPTALAACRSRMPALILLDVGMPGMDGHEVARRVRALDGGGGVLIAGLSGWGQPEDRRRGREAGFDVHLVKPAGFDAVRDLLRGLPRRDGG